MERSDLQREILRSKKYRGVDASVVQRICSDKAARYTKKAEALKAAKNELHIIHESFLHHQCHQNALALLSALPPGCCAQQMETAVLQLMRLHTSTQERLAEIYAIYSFIGRHIAADSTVMDIGCGFNPFSLPLLHERPKSYYAYDINTETIRVLNTFFAKIGAPQYKAKIVDVIPETPQTTIDVVLMLKLFPLLQQQKKGRGFELLSALRFRKAIVSFPLRSMSGKRKGMEAFYASAFEDGLPSALQIIERRSFLSESFYVIARQEGDSAHPIDI